MLLLLLQLLLLLLLLLRQPVPASLLICKSGLQV
jgi:hypothetical protein